jgi:putative membrane protein
MSGSEQGKPVDEPKPAAAMRDHLANERTLLAWIRTAITVVGLGFLLDRLVAEQDQAQQWIRYAGIALALFGALLAAAGGYSYMSTRRLLGTGPYRSNAALHLGMVFIVVVGALLVALFLVTQ